MVGRSNLTLVRVYHEKIHYCKHLKSVHNYTVSNWIIARGISVFEAFPSTSGRRLLGKDLAAKRLFLQSYKLIVRYSIRSSRHLCKEPCYCITMHVRSTACIALSLINFSAQCL